jgi:DNA polymerase-3 subunit gamma/tau
LLGRKDLDLAPDLKSGFEMVLLRALAFRPGSASGSKKSAPIKANTGAESSLKKPQSEVSPVPQAQQKITPKVELVENHKPAVIQQVEPEITPVKEQAAVEQNVADLPVETNNNITLNQLAPNNWLEVHSQLKLGASLGEIASHCLLSERRENQLFFIIDQEQTSLYDAAHQQSLAEALSDYFGVQVSVEISFGKTQKETPRAANIRAKEERLAAAIEVLNQDPDLQEFKQKFDANLDTKTVRPID